MRAGGGRRPSNDNGIMLVVGIRRGAIRHRPLFKQKTGTERMGEGRGQTIKELRL